MADIWLWEGGKFGGLHVRDGLCQRKLCRLLAWASWSVVEAAMPRMGSSSLRQCNRGPWYPGCKSSSYACCAPLLPCPLAAACFGDASSQNSSPSSRSLRRSSSFLASLSLAFIPITGKSSPKPCTSAKSSSASAWKGTSIFFLSGQVQDCCTIRQYKITPLYWDQYWLIILVSKCTSTRLLATDYEKLAENFAGMKFSCNANCLKR